MKDIVLSTKRQKTELYTLLACFAVTNLLNLYAILTHDAPLTELVTSFFYVLTATIVLYVAWTALRLVYYALRKILNKNNNLKQ